MDNLLAARMQMAISFVFHILFAVAGIGMPLLMVAAEGLWLRTRDEAYLALAKNWAKGAAILFAVGAVSGTVLSFELGLLWPRFMQFAGALFGLPFALEGFAFFTEAIFLGILLYGWDRVSPRAHLFAGVVVAASGQLSAFFVLSANAWMQHPVGFRMLHGRAVDVQPLAPLFNPATYVMALHMALATYAAIGFAVAGIHALQLLKGHDSRFHRHALRLGLLLGGVCALIQPFSGDLLARYDARNEPVKLAAMESQWRTQRGAPLRIGGIPDANAEVDRYAIEVPKGLSLLAFHDPNAVVQGLDTVPKGDRPNVTLVHLSFQVMVGCGTLMALVALWAGGLAWRRRSPADDRLFLRAVVATGPLGLVAIEAGWMTTEIGRQPWIVHGIMRTSEAVTPMPGLIVPMTTFTLLYLFLAAVVIWLLARQVASSPGAIVRPGTHQEARHAVP